MGSGQLLPYDTLDISEEALCEFRFCKGVFDEASHGVHTHPYRLPEPNPGKHKWSGAKEGKRWGKAGNKPMKLSHIHFSSHQGAALTYSSSISFGVCISNSKLLPPGEKGEEDVTSFLQLAKPPRSTYTLSCPNEGTQSHNPGLLHN